MKYIPQSAPFEMIDELIAADELKTESVFTVREGHILVNKGYFTEPGLMENMAQTAAAGTGFNAHKSGEKPPVGYIGAIKNWQLIKLPAVGEQIRTIVEPMNTIGNAHIVKASVFLSGELLVSAVFTIFLQS